MEPRGNVGLQRQDKILQMISRGRETLAGIIPRKSHLWRRQGLKCAKQQLPGGKKKSNLKVENYALFGGFLKLKVQKTASQIALKNCSQEVGE